MINLIVDDKESVVSLVEYMDFNGWILGIVLFDIQFEFIGNLIRVKSGFYRGTSFVHENQYAFIHVVVDEDYITLTCFKC